MTTVDDRLPCVVDLCNLGSILHLSLLSPPKMQSPSSISQPSPGTVPTSSGSQLPEFALKMDLRDLQYRLVHLYHAAHCNQSNRSPPGPCHASRRCVEHLVLLRHCETCKNPYCKVADCPITRFILYHYRHCADGACILCSPLNENLRRINRRKSEMRLVKRKRCDDTDVVDNRCSLTEDSKVLKHITVDEKLTAGVVSTMTPDDSSEKSKIHPSQQSPEDMFMSFSCCETGGRMNDYLCVKCGMVLQSGSVHFNCNLCATVVCSDCMRSNHGGHEHPMRTFRISS